MLLTLNLFHAVFNTVPVGCRKQLQTSPTALPSLAWRGYSFPKHGGAVVLPLSHLQSQLFYPQPSVNRPWHQPGWGGGMGSILKHQESSPGDKWMYFWSQNSDFGVPTLHRRRLRSNYKRHGPPCLFLNLTMSWDTALLRKNSDSADIREQERGESDRFYKGSWDIPKTSFVSLVKLPRKILKRVWWSSPVVQ